MFNSFSSFIEFIYTFFDTYLHMFFGFFYNLKEFIVGCLKTFFEFFKLFSELNTLFVSLAGFLPGELAPLVLIFISVVYAVIFLNLFKMLFGFLMRG